MKVINKRTSVEFLHLTRDIAGSVSPRSLADSFIH